jgi:stage IV sporulation protein FA
MEANDKVKQHRIDRIHRLRDETPDRDLGYQLPPEQQQHPLYDPNWNRRMEDPEFVWRQRYKQEHTLNGNGEQRNGWTPSFRTFWNKVMVSVLLFAAIWGLFHLQQPWADKGRQWVVAALTQTMDVQALSVWYQDKFGDTPSFIPSFRNRDANPAVKASTEKRTYFKPAQGKITVPFDSAHSGLLLETQADAPVYALDTGQVIFAGTKEDTGFTVIIRHPLGLESIYGRMNESHVEVNDWIKGGEPIGKVSKEAASSGSLFFAMTKEGSFIDPTDVIPFD